MKKVKRPTAIPEDEQLPQLERVLDSDWMTSTLRGTGTVPTAAASKPVYVRYKPGTNCLILHEVTRTDGSVHWVYSKSYSEDRTGRPSDQFRISVYLREYRIALSSFPFDQQIPALRVLWESRRDSLSLRKLISSRRRPRFTGNWGNWEPIRYKPERRCLLRGTYRDSRRAESEERGFFARLYADDRGARTAGWHRHFVSLSEDRIKLPNCLAYDSKYRVLLIKELRGIPLKHFLNSGRSHSLQGIDATASALARWHQLVPPSGVLSMVDHTGVISAAVAAVESISDPAAQSAGYLAAELLRKAPPPPERLRLIHGDFYFDQILFQPGSQRVRILDLDRLALGNPVIDLANFCAHLYPLVVEGALSESKARWIEGRFLQSYQLAADHLLSDQNFRWFKAAALLSLATSPFRRFRTDWPAEVSQILGEAIACWEGGQC